MKGEEFWLPVARFLVATPVCLIVASASAGAGRSGDVIAVTLFPHTMLGAVLIRPTDALLAVLFFAQFPLYGIVLGAANVKGRLKPAALALLAAHAPCAVASFVVLVGGVQ